MKITTRYSRIERVIYEFDKSDVQRALLAMEKIPPYQKDRRIVFDMDDEGAAITVIYEQEQATAASEEE